MKYWVWKQILGEGKNVCPKILAPEKKICVGKSWVQKNFKRKFGCEKNVGTEKKLGLEKHFKYWQFLSPKKSLGAKKFLVCKKFGS